MKASIRYTFSAPVWQHAATGGWYFVSLPAALATEIRSQLKWQEAGWGRMNVTAQMGETTWDTAIWFDTKQQTYLLPIKAMVRKKELMNVGQAYSVTIWV